MILKKSTNIKREFVGAKVFYRENDLAYQQPQFLRHVAVGREALTSTTISKKYGVMTSSGMPLLKTDLEHIYHIHVSVNDFYGYYDMSAYEV